jgi:hypothetical protein
MEEWLKRWLEWLFSSQGKLAMRDGLRDGLYGFCLGRVSSLFALSLVLNTYGPPPFDGLLPGLLFVAAVAWGASGGSPIATVVAVAGIALLIARIIPK